MRAIFTASLIATGLATGLALGLAPLAAQAQGVHCEGRLQVDPVTVTDVPGSREGNEARRHFSVGLRNMTAQGMLVFIRVGQLPGVPLAGTRETELDANAARRHAVLSVPTNTTLTPAQVQGVLQYFCR